MSKLIVLDGLDGSGKSTQFERLCTIYPRLTGISFPDYSSKSAALVNMYLQGEISDDPDDINPYAASSFYAADRFISYVKHWKSTYLAGGNILAGRYTTSNAIHQAAKLKESEFDGFYEWLCDYEYNKMGLPRPDRVILLDIAPELAQKRLKGREGAPDIHESHMDYFNRCYKAAHYFAEKQGWTVIPAEENGRELSADEITRKLCAVIDGIING